MTPLCRLQNSQHRKRPPAPHVVRFGLLVTATVNQQDDLPRARAAVDNLAAPARVMLRPVWGSQASAFAAGLPIGLVLPLHLAVPATIRDNM